uniref:DNA polymerase n=1 Tax=Thelephora aurantiotincta TaxID=654496 RepID=A0A7T0CP44_9AGAM|nr:DNA polymerase [Thelephora aurantiotincta]QPJ78312.1 DNA polymerase [Thelephora aurantiotincta]
MIKTQKYNLNSNLILTNEVLNSYVLRFWGEVFTPLIEGDQPIHLMILCKVKYGENKNELYKTLGPLRRVEFKDQELFCGYLQERLGILYDSYKPDTNVSEIIFTYVIKNIKISDSDRALLQDLSNKELPFHNFNKISLPVSMNPEDYGNIIADCYVPVDGTSIHRYVITNANRTYQIDISNKGLTNNVTILGLSDFNWIDTKISDDSFKREIGKSTIYFLDGEIILQKLQLNSKKFKKGVTVKTFTNTFRHNRFRNS